MLTLDTPTVTPFIQFSLDKYKHMFQYYLFILVWASWLYDGVYGVDHPVLRDHVQLHHPRRAAAAAHPHALAEDVVQAALGADLPRTNQRACSVVLCCVDQSQLTVSPEAAVRVEDPAGMRTAISGTTCRSSTASVTWVRTL